MQALTPIGHSAEAIRTKTLKALALYFRDANYILTGRVTTVEIAPSGNAPAWSKKNDIWINGPMAPAMRTMLDYIKVTGLNWHEMCHVLLTPPIEWVTREGPAEMADRMLTDQEYGHAFNLLEDQRIETMMVARFASMKAYFTHVFTHYCLASEDAIKTAYLLAHGRRYLGKDLRRQLAKVFQCNDRRAVIKEAARIIDAYRRLNLARSRDLYHAHELILEFCAVLRRANLTDKTPQCHTADRIKAEGLAGGAERKMMPADQQDALQKRAERQEGRDKDQGDVDTSEGDAPWSDMRDAKDAINDALDAANHDDQVQREASAARDFAERKRSLVMDTITWRDMRTISVSRDWITTAMDLSDALKVTEMDNDPHWIRNQPNGRLNIGKAMNAAPYDDVWDQWVPGGYGGLDLELCVLLDISSSMDSQQQQLREASWTIKRAADLANVSCSMWAYNGSSFSVYTSDDRADMDCWPCLSTSGSTQPYRALIDAHTTIDASQRRLKILVIMTDGSWNRLGDEGVAGFTSSDAIIEDMGDRLRTHTAMIYLQKSIDPSRRLTEDQITWHSVKQRFMIDDMTEMAGVVRDIMLEAMTGVMY